MNRQDLESRRKFLVDRLAQVQGDLMIQKTKPWSPKLQLLKKDIFNITSELSSIKGQMRAHIIDPKYGRVTHNPTHLLVCERFVTEAKKRLSPELYKEIMAAVMNNDGLPVLPNVPLDMSETESAVYGLFDGPDVAISVQEIRNRMIQRTELTDRAFKDALESLEAKGAIYKNGKTGYIRAV